MEPTTTTEINSDSIMNSLEQADISQTTGVFISASIISVLIINAILFIFLKFIIKARN